MDSNQSNILRSKFFKPEPSSDIVVRDDLLQMLSDGKNKPLLLISAPAGYGKSTLVSSWLTQQNFNYGWISLSEYDNNWLSFVRYLLEGLKHSIPGIFDDSVEIIKTPEIPDVREISDSIVNSLTNLHYDYYLVLDDYHFLRAPEIHQMMESILRFPPPKFHLIIITRTDPPFKIQQFRTKNVIAEIRSEDMAFNDKEAESFLMNATGHSVDVEICRTANKLTEGWITGLRLISYKLKNNKDFTRDLMIKQKRNITHDLLEEVFADFSSTVQEFILKSSVLFQFNDSISATLCEMEKQSDAQEIIDELCNSNLFIIPIDQNKGWFRFHHLFQDFLKTKFQNEYSEKDQQSVHLKAALWLEDKGILNNSIVHFIRSGQIEKAVAIFESYRHQLMNDTLWQDLIQAYNLFKTELLESHIDLMLAGAWINIYEGKPFEMFSKLENIKSMIDSTKLSERRKIRHKAELHCLIAYKNYNVDQDYQKLHKQCDYAISHLEQDQVYAKGYAWIFKLAAMQVSGKYSEAKELVAREINSSARPINAHLLLILNYLEWLEADLYALADSSKHLTDIGIRQGNQEAIANGNHFHGICYYMINNIDLAQYYLKKSYEKRRHTIGVIKLMNSVALAFCHLATNDFSQAESIILEAKNEIRNKNSLYFNTMLEAAHAEIHIATNNIKVALNILKGVDALPLVPFSNFYAPQYTYVKALIYADEKSILDLALKLLMKYLNFCKETNNRLFELKFKALHSIYLFKHDREKDAFEIIDFLMKIAEAIQAVRVFIDAGSLMMKLLLKYELRAAKNMYLSKVINAFSFTGDQDLFSRREMDVLPLLYQSNKEIAETLFIAEKTVKRHVNGIFKKLRVKNRREALQKAIELKLV